MDLNATLDIIIRDLEETREIIDDLRGYPGVPVLQIELAKSKCRSAGEMIALLKDLPESGITGSPQKIPERTGPKAAPPEQKKPEPVKEAVKPVFTMPAPEKLEKDQGQERSSTESQILADQFTDAPESFNDKLAGQKQEDITEILKSRPVSSLTEAIGISDKFLFIREIFNGSLEAYNNTIEKLDASASMADAREIIGSFPGIQGESEGMKQMMNLLRRKFPSDE